MTIFRHKNGKLYTLALIKGSGPYSKWTGEFLSADPYHHDVQIKRPHMKDFTAIAEWNSVPDWFWSGAQYQ